MALTMQSKPDAATHWSTRKLGAVLGVSACTVMRHWQANGLNRSGCGNTQRSSVACGSLVQTMAAVQAFGGVRMVGSAVAASSG